MLEMPNKSSICFLFDARGAQTGPFSLPRTLEMLDELGRRRDALGRPPRVEVWCLGWPRRLPLRLACPRLQRDLRKYAALPAAR